MGQVGRRHWTYGLTFGMGEVFYGHGSLYINLAATHRYLWIKTDWGFGLCFTPKHVLYKCEISSTKNLLSSYEELLFPYKSYVIEWENFVPTEWGSNHLSRKEWYLPALCVTGDSLWKIGINIFLRADRLLSLYFGYPFSNTIYGRENYTLASVTIR